MFEIKCDVKGCTSREPVQLGILGGGGVPAGWRIIQYDEMEMPKPMLKHRDPTEAARKFARTVGGEAGKAYEELLVASMPEPRTRVLGRHVTKHVCERHPMLEFVSEDDEGDLGGDAA